MFTSRVLFGNVLFTDLLNSNVGLNRPETPDVICNSHLVHVVLACGRSSFHMPSNSSLVKLQRYFVESSITRKNTALSSCKYKVRLTLRRGEEFSLQGDSSYSYFS